LAEAGAAEDSADSAGAAAVAAAQAAAGRQQPPSGSERWIDLQQEMDARMDAKMDATLKELVRRLKEFAADNLESVILYGSAARGEYHQTHSDLNVLCTLGSLSVGELARIAPAVTWWCMEKKEPAPMLFSSGELQRSADVFSIELLDIQKTHRVLYGPDVVSAISVPLNLHRLQVEHDLRVMILKLRQRFLHVSGKPEELSAILADSISSVRTLLRHSLIAMGEEPPAGPHDLFARIAALCGADAAALGRAWHARTARLLPEETSGVYSAYLATLEKVISTLERHAPKQEWQRRGGG
jgi:hypothetical protein